MDDLEYVGRQLESMSDNPKYYLNMGVAATGVFLGSTINATPKHLLDKVGLSDNFSAEKRSLAGAIASYPQTRAIREVSEYIEEFSYSFDLGYALGSGAMYSLPKKEELNKYRNVFDA